MKNSKFQNIDKILFIRLSSLGDVLLTSSTLRIVRNRFPKAQIDYLCSKEFSEILEFNPAINRIIKYDKSLTLSKIKQLRYDLLAENGGKYDLVIDLQRNRRSQHFRYGIGKQVIKTKKYRFRKTMMVSTKNLEKFSIPPIPIVHLNALKAAGVIDDNLGTELWTQKDFIENAYSPYSEPVRTGEIMRIAVAPAAKHFTKMLPAVTFANAIIGLAKQYQCEFILLGGGDAVQPAAEIIEKVRLHGFVCGNDDVKYCSIKDYSGKTSILETASLLDDCDLLISNDSALMHIASARQVPVAVIFGSTVPEFGFAPFRVKHAIIQQKVKCRPCTHIGLAKCPKKHFKCMNQITGFDIIFAVNKLLKK